MPQAQVSFVLEVVLTFEALCADGKASDCAQILAGRRQFRAACGCAPKLQNFMDRGVDLTWISAFPHERQFLYSPLTYMMPVREEPVVVQIGGVTYQVRVIEVKVQM